MREKLAEREGRRSRFHATFSRFGTKSAYKGPPIKTALFRDVKDAAGTVVTDHIWMVVGVQLARLELKPDDVIYFDARVTCYEKGYRGRREDDDLPPPSIDYRPSFPTNFVKVKTEECVLGNLFSGLAAKSSS